MKTKVILSQKKPDFFDRFMLYYLEGRKLSDKQEAKRIQYEQAHGQRILGMSKEQTVKILVSRKIVPSQREAYRVVNRAEQLYGDINAVHKDGFRHILTENLSRIQKKAIEAGEYKEAIKANEVMAKINGLISSDSDPIDWSALVIPIPVYTSDVKVLKDQETLDISHEIMEDDD